MCVGVRQGEIERERERTTCVVCELAGLLLPTLVILRRTESCVIRAGAPTDVAEQLHTDTHTHTRSLTRKLSKGKKPVP